MIYTMTPEKAVKIADGEDIRSVLRKLRDYLAKQS